MPSQTSPRVAPTCLLSNEEILRIASEKIPAETLATEGSTQTWLAEYALHLKQALMDNGLAARVLDSTPILGTILSVRFEQSSSRIVIEFISDHPNRAGTRETEHFRSDRTDGPRREDILSMWRNAAGKRAVIYKYNEATNNPERPTVRVAPYVQLLGPAETRTQGGSTNGQPRSGAPRR